MQAAFTIRRFRLGDYPAVVRLWRRAKGVEVAEGDDRTGILAYLKRNPGLSQVAIHERRIVGAVLCGHDGRRGLIYHLAVSPKHQGAGIGSRLVENCVAGLKAKGIRRVLILVAKDNPEGRAFWQARGFEKIPGAEVLGRDT